MVCKSKFTLVGEPILVFNHEFHITCIWLSKNRQPLYFSKIEDTVFANLKVAYLVQCEMGASIQYNGYIDVFRWRRIFVGLRILLIYMLYMYHYLFFNESLCEYACCLHIRKWLVSSLTRERVGVYYVFHRKGTAV